MTGADVFQAQLRPGERVLWSAPQSAAVRDAAYRHSRQRGLLRAAGSAIFGALGTWLAYESGRAWLAQPADISSALRAALLLALTALLIACCVMFVRLYLRTGAMHRIATTWHSHFVLTDQRLFYVDRHGELIDELEGHEIVAVELEEAPMLATVLVERRTNEEEDKHLILTNLEQPHVAKAKIVETFLKPRS